MVRWSTKTSQNHGASFRSDVQFPYWARLGAKSTSPKLCCRKIMSSATTMLIWSVNLNGGKYEVNFLMKLTAANTTDLGLPASVCSVLTLFLPKSTARSTFLLNHLGNPSLLASVSKRNVGQLLQLRWGIIKNSLALSLHLSLDALWLHNLDWVHCTGPWIRTKCLDWLQVSRGRKLLHGTQTWRYVYNRKFWAISLNHHQWFQLQEWCHRINIWPWWLIVARWRQGCSSTPAKTQSRRYLTPYGVSFNSNSLHLHANAVWGLFWASSILCWATNVVMVMINGGETLKLCSFWELKDAENGRSA